MLQSQQLPGNCLLLVGDDDWPYSVRNAKTFKARGKGKQKSAR